MRRSTPTSVSGIQRIGARILARADVEAIDTAYREKRPLRQDLRGAPFEVLAWCGVFPPVYSAAPASMNSVVSTSASVSARSPH
jgi:hypothetical protein